MGTSFRRPPRSRSSWATTSRRSTGREALEAIRERPTEAGLLLDLDGTLSSIAARPELATPIQGARVALAALVLRYAVVAIVTGRRSEEAAAILGVDGIRYEGLYGLTDAASELVLALVPRVERAAAVEPAAWVENKVASLAIHYRQAVDPARAHARLVAALEPIAGGSGMDLLEGKMVLELVPADRPLKGGAVERIVGELRLASVLFAGDDRADIDAFAALDRLAERGLAVVRVAVRGDGTPSELIDAADVVVDGPGGLVELLGSL